MASESLIIKASTFGRVIPIGNARVFISQRDENGGERILASRTTNGSGETNIIEIETPEKILSAQPGNAKAYETIDIRIEHPLFYTHYITGAQVFADTESVQNATLIPLAIPTENITDRVIITPQNL